MSQVTIQKLLEPISKEVPCGEILEDNPDFFILKDMLDGKEETQWSPYEPPDWKNILRMSKGLLLKGKDLWVVVIFVYASTEIYGLEGLKKGLEFLRDMTTKYWSDIQPELDGENEDDFTLMRLNPLATMASEHEHLCKMLKRMRLIETQRIGKFNYNDIKVLSDETAVRNEALANVEIEHIASDLKQEKYEETVSLLKDCIKIVKEIDDFITEKVGEKNNVSNLNKLIEFMDDMLKLFGKCIGKGDGNDGDEEDSDTTEEVNFVKGTNTSVKVKTINSRKDFNKIINDLCKWLKDNDPSSFTYYYLQKAKESFGKDCWASIDDFKGIMDFGTGIFGTHQIQNQVSGAANCDSSKDSVAEIVKKAEDNGAAKNNTETNYAKMPLSEETTLDH